MAYQHQFYTNNNLLSAATSVTQHGLSLASTNSSVVTVKSNENGGITFDIPEAAKTLPISPTEKLAVSTMSDTEIADHISENIGTNGIAPPEIFQQLISHDVPKERWESIWLLTFYRVSKRAWEESRIDSH